MTTTKVNKWNSCASVVSWAPVKKPPQGSPVASTGGSGKRGVWKSLPGEGDP